MWLAKAFVVYSLDFGPKVQLITQCRILMVKFTVNYVGKIHKISSWPKFKLYRFYNLRVNFTTGKAGISANPQKVFIPTVAQRELRYF